MDPTVVITSTGTSVGKTWVTVGLTRELRTAGMTVALRKVCEAADPEDDELDSVILSRASGESPSVICPPQWSYPVAMAPPMAAEELGLPVPKLSELLASLDERSTNAEVCLVESVGGLRSPFALNGDTVDLIAALQPSLVVLVVNAELGVINLVRLSLGALSDVAVVVYLNRYDETSIVHRKSRKWLEEREAAVVVTDLAQLAERVRAAPVS